MLWAPARASLVCLVLIGCNKPAPQPTGFSIPTKEFTAESKGLKFSFRYPASWELVPQAPPNATLGIALVPADKEPGTSIEFLLVDGADAERMIAELPLIPSTAATARKELASIDGHEFHRTEWQGRIEGTPIYRHYACLDGAVGKRFVSLRCYTTAAEEKHADADQRFERHRKLFEAVLKTARIEANR